ncbi:MAG: TolC family protein [Planctomycetales bacterium]|nr:TolC family protein [Planctomycetales bacterium]
MFESNHITTGCQTQSHWYACGLSRIVFIALSIVFGTIFGCSRSQYRRNADRESYCLINSRQSDPRWELPTRPVEPAANSRMYVAVVDECGPKPQDDLAAKRYMDCPDCKDNTRYYDRIPNKSSTENPIWVDYLPRNEDGSVDLTQQLAIDLALIHSRDYQTEFESVYGQALVLSGNRFEFDAQWFGGLGAGFTANGADLGGGRTLAVTTDRLGFSRSLAGGGQFATSILNGLSWNFASGGVSSGSAALVTTFTQPLLRGAFRHVRLENLTQAERSLLYAVRDFARFRRLFYVDVTTSYLGLLSQAQAIRNTQTNVANLSQNLVEHQSYAELETVSQVAVDQVFQQYQNGRLSLLSAEQSLITSQDAFKFQLGLPAWVPFKIDETLLEPFELVEPELEMLQEEAQQLYQRLVQYLPPERAPKAFLLSAYDEFVQLRERVNELAPDVQAEFETWKKRIDQTDVAQLASDDRLDLEQQRTISQRVEASLAEVNLVLADRETSNATVLKLINEYEEDATIASDADEAKKALLELLDSTETVDPAVLEQLMPKSEDRPATAALKAMQEAVGVWLRQEIAELYVAQTQIRVFLIDIERKPIQQEAAITFAHQNRLDLMNSKALVMDAFRKVEVAADRLESDLSVSGGIALGNDRSKDSAFRFDSSASSYNVGVEFDGPLNRLNERNAYRAAQIVYQRASRDYIADKDRVANEVRSVLRQLELLRLNFKITRQQVVTATRQVDQAQINLRNSQVSSDNLTLFLLDALQATLDAKNRLISTWLQYRIQKMRLFTALDLLYIDENGSWINEDSGLEQLADFMVIDPEYFPPQWVDAYSTGNVNGSADAESLYPGSDGAESDSNAVDAPGEGGEPLPVPDPAGAQAAMQSDSDLKFRAGVVAPSLPIAIDLDR